MTLDSKAPLTGSYIEEMDTQEHLDMMKKFENLSDRIDMYTENDDPISNVSQFSGILGF